MDFKGGTMRLVGLLAVLMFGCGAGPTAIVGTITDETMAPVYRAEVITEPHTELVLTNRKGMFSITQVFDEQDLGQSLPSGHYKIIVRRTGFTDLEFEVDVDGPTRLEPRMMTPKILDVGPALGPGITPNDPKDLRKGDTPIDGV